MSEVSTPTAGFGDLGLAPHILQALDDVGYEDPSPIQALTIPHVLAGEDIVGQAQTGTGKTAAFALPLLSNLDISKAKPQVLVLAPTRELAIQVAEAFQRYASRMPGFHVLPVYGGQAYGGQLKQLRRGVHVVVGTPGRLADHLRRGSLKLDELTCVVIDEADEMLRMGFIDEVEWILEQTPSERQVALFSATMPAPIRRVAQKHLKNPAEVTISPRETQALSIRQRYWMVSGLHKLDALTRILEGEPFESMIVFVRTRVETTRLAEKLEARGYSTAPLSGEISQALRERTVERFRAGKLDILVATDVAARGLDIDRVSHVLNYDIPADIESYIHRIGRTGRAGRSGEAILFVAPRERRLLRAIENATRQPIELMKLPSREKINDARMARFKQRIEETLATEELGFYYQLIEEFRQEHNVPALEIASALARMVQGDEPLLLEGSGFGGGDGDRGSREAFGGGGDGGSGAFAAGAFAEQPAQIEYEPYRIEVGRAHGVLPNQIVGAIANEAGLQGRHIGRIQIEDDHSVVELPKGMPGDILAVLRAARICGQPSRMQKISGPDERLFSRHHRPPGRPGGRPGGKFGPKKKFSGKGARLAKKSHRKG